MTQTKSGPSVSSIVSARGFARVADSTDYGEIFCCFPGAVVVFSPNHECKDFNDQFCQFLGYHRSELLGTSWVHIIHPDDLNDGLERLERLTGPYKDEYIADERLLRKDGSQIDVQSTVRAVGDGDGNVKFLIGLYQDITERKRHERTSTRVRNELEHRIAQHTAALSTVSENLLAKDRHLQVFLDHSPLGMNIRDRDGRYVLVNREFERRYGDSAIGRTVYDLHTQEDADYIAEQDRQILEAKVGQICELEMTSLDGVEHLISCRRFPILDEHGDAIAVGSIGVDITDTRKGEIALRESEKRFQLAVHGSMDGMWDFSDIEDDEFWWSPQSFELLGFEVGEVQPSLSFVKSLCHPDDIAPWLEARRRHLETGATYDVYMRLRVKSGEYRWFQTRGNAIFDEEGKAGRMTGTLRDVQDKFQVIDELNRQKTLLEAILSAVPDAMIITDAAEKLKMANSGFSSVFGHRTDDFIGHPISKLLVAGEAGLASTFSETGPTVVDYQRNDGQVFAGETVSTPIRGPQNEELGHLLVVRDITQRLVSELALRKSEERFRSIAVNAQHIIWVGDPARGYFEYVNPAFEKTFGISCDTLYKNGQAWMDAVLEEDRHLAKTSVVAFAQGEFKLHEYRIRRPDGEIRWIRERIFFIGEQDGSRGRVGGFASDSTHAMTAEAERLNAVRAQRDALVGEVHHRIKNHLQGVTGLLSRFASERPPLKEVLDHVSSQVNAIAMVHGIQSRSPTGVLCFTDMVDAIASSCAGLFDKEIELIWSARKEPELRLVDNEAVPIALIVNELTTNALKYGRQDSRVKPVSLKGTTDETHLSIEISNNLEGDNVDFDYEAGVGLGTGLTLVKSLQPPEGAELSFSVYDGRLTAHLSLSSPVVALR